jgi:DNA-directed RNA polymerase subunit RPC12/RpoP
MGAKSQLAIKTTTPDLSISPEDEGEKLFRCLHCGRALFKGIIISASIKCRRCGAYNKFVVKQDGNIQYIEDIS